MTRPASAGNLVLARTATRLHGGRPGAQVERDQGVVAPPESTVLQAGTAASWISRRLVGPLRRIGWHSNVMGDFCDNHSWYGPRLFREVREHVRGRRTSRFRDRLKNGTLLRLAFDGGEVGLAEPCNE